MATRSVSPTPLHHLSGLSTLHTHLFDARVRCTSVDLEECLNDAYNAGNGEPRDGSNCVSRRDATVLLIEQRIQPLRSAPRVRILFKMHPS